MHETERHRIILSAVQEKPVVTVQEMVDLTDMAIPAEFGRHLMNAECANYDRPCCGLT